MHNSSRLVALLGAFTILSAVIATDAQARRQTGTTVRQQEQQPKKDQKPVFHVGDVTLSGFDKLTFRQEEWVQAAGPGTTVDASDPKQPEVKSRLQSPLIKAFIDTKDQNEVVRVDVAGPVRFLSIRPVGKLGSRSLRGTAAHAVYYRSEGRMELQGPITFEGEQPTADGKGKQTATGKAARATYDLNKEIIILSGNVETTLLHPDRKQPSKLTGAEQVTIELSDKKYQLDVNGGSIHFDASKPTDEKKP